MANDESADVKRVVFCSTLCAGFAYVSYNIISKLFYRKTAIAENGESNEIDSVNSKYLNKGVQTEAPLIIGDYFNTKKSVRERVKDLNVISQQLRKSSIPLPVSPEVKPHTNPTISWSSPLGCAKYLSFSAENISSTSPLSSPDHKKKSKFPNVQGGKSIECLSALKDYKIPIANAVTVHKIPLTQDLGITLKTLSSLQKQPRKMTLFETRNIVSLLQSDNEDVLIKTLSTVSNCAAFSSNQELLCNSDCPERLYELIQHSSQAVKVAASHAVSNIAVTEKGYLYFQPHIPILFANALHGKELLKSISLTALANLALNDNAHKTMIGNVNCVIRMAESSNDVIQLQALRLLVNLSCNKDIIPFLLLSKVSPCLFDLLHKPTDREIRLRFVTFLANIITFAVQDLNISSKNSTLMSFLYKMKERPEFEHIIKLTGDNDEDLSFQAKRVCDSL